MSQQTESGHTFELLNLLDQAWREITFLLLAVIETNDDRPAVGRNFLMFTTEHNMLNHKIIFS